MIGKTMFRGICFPILACGFLSAMSAEAARSRPGSIDGATVYSIENFQQLGSSQFSVGFGIYPLDAYCTAFDVNAAYSYFFTDSLGWEVIRFHEFFNSQTDLARQLADKYGVNPKSIDSLKAAVSTSFLYSFAYGKHLLFNRYFFYDRLIGVLGVGQVNSQLRSSYAGILGLRGDFAIDEHLSWIVEGRYHIVSNTSQDNQLGLMIGTGYNF